MNELILISKAIGLLLLSLVIIIPLGYLVFWIWKWKNK